MRVASDGNLDGRHYSDCPARIVSLGRLSLIGIGVAGLEIVKRMPVQRLLGQDVWSSLTSPELVALPLFILMGEILFHMRLAEQSFCGLSPWVGWIAGKLLYVNILGSAIFAAPLRVLPQRRRRR